LWYAGCRFTVSSDGFIALSGVAILNGLVLVEFIKEKLQGDAAGRWRCGGCLVPAGGRCSWGRWWQR